MIVRCAYEPLGDRLDEASGDLPVTTTQEAIYGANSLVELVQPSLAQVDFARQECVEVIKKFHVGTYLAMLLVSESCNLRCGSNGSAGFSQPGAQLRQRLPRL